MIIKRVVKILLLSLSLNLPLCSHTSLGIDLGMEQHVAGGGPVLGLIFYKPSYRVGLSLNTQINAFTPYELGPYDGYRFADDFKQFFGGRIHFGYVFKSRSGQRIKPLLEYRSNYFYTRYGKNEKQMGMSGEFYRAFFIL